MEASSQLSRSMPSVAGRVRTKGKTRRVRSALAAIRRKPQRRAAGKRDWRAVAGRVAFVVFLLAASLLCCRYVNNIIGYLPLLLSVIALVACAVYVNVVHRALSIDDANTIRTCRRGDTVDFSMLFANNSIVPLSLFKPHFCLTDIFGEVDAELDVALTLASRETLDYGFGVSFAHIGTYEVRLDGIDVYDPFGLFSRRVDVSRSYQISVTPHVFPVGKLAEYQTSESENLSIYRPIITDSMDYAHVRDYEPGDPLKTIHWKLSARSDDYFTKLYEAYVMPGISIFIDFSAPDYDAECMMSAFDGVVESAFSIMMDASQMGMAAELVYCDKLGAERHEANLTYAKAIDLLAGMPNLSHDIPPDLVRSTIRTTTDAFRSNENIVVCTSSISEDLVSEIGAIKRKRKNPVLVLSLPTGASEEVRSELRLRMRRLSSLGVAVYQVGDAAELSTCGKGVSK